MRAGAGWVGQVIAWTVILGAAAVLTAAVALPRLAGATPYTVLTGSMEPGYPPGTLVVVKPVEAEQLRTGDVITYQLKSGASTVVTHRVVEVATSLGGEIALTTQGDANGAPDTQPVQPVQVRGRLWYSIPYLGHVSALLNGSQRQQLVYIAGAGLLGYAAYMFTSALRDRSRRKEEPAT